MTYLRKNRHLQLITLTAFLFLAVVAPMLYVFTMRPKTAEAAWFDDTYAYRLKITFTHNADISAERAVTYSLDTAEIIAANLMQSDCDDTRFTDGNGKPLLYDLTGTCNNAATTYEVIFPTIVNGSNLAYVYYGNPAAANGEISSTGYTALTPSPGGDPASTTPTSDDEQGPAPISYWNFDEAQGSTANDYSTGSNNDLTITAATWKVSDLCVFGNCLYFDGSTDYATKSYSADTELLPSTGSFTVTAWFKHASTAGADTLISRADAVAGVGWKVYMDSSGFMCFGIDDTATSFPSDSACTTTSYADSQWHFVTAVKSTTASITIFIDGQQAGQDASLLSVLTLNGTNAPFTVGNDFDNGTNGWDGFIDEVKYYNFAKTTPQIIAEYASKSAPKGTAASFGAGDAAHSLSQGLVGYWKMDETAANSCTGGVNDSCDSSGNANNAAWAASTADPAPTRGKFGNGVDFDGNDYATAADSSSLDLTQFSLSSWVILDITTGSYIFEKGTDGESANFYLWYSGSGDACGSNVLCAGFLNTTGQWKDHTYSWTPTVGQWYHIAATYDGSRFRIYIDGSLVTDISEIDTPLTNNGSLFFGVRRNAASEFLDGTLDEARIYNRALTPSEVAALYNWAPGPVGWWKMDENTGTAANDSSGFGNTGTLTNGPIWTTGKFGQALDFDGSNDSIEVSNEIIFNGSLSFSAWFKTDTVAAGVAYIVDRTTGTNEIVNLYRSGSDLVWRLRGDDGVGITTLTITGALSANTWYHAVGVRDTNDDTLKLYINGVFQNSTPDNTTGTISPIFKFGRHPDNHSPWDGTIDDIKTYNYARTPKQIVEDMNAGHPAGGSPVGSQAVYWNFDEGQGTTANNSGTASSSNGTLTSIASPATSTSGWTFTGKVNKGIVFDGTDDNVVIATANDAAVDFATTEQFSASAWVYVTTMPGSGNQDAIIAKWDETGNLAAYKLYVENDDADTTGNFEVQIYDESASQAITASQVIDQVAVNTWYHVSFTFNGGVAGAAGDLKLYVNGSLTAQNAANASFLGLEDLASDFTVGDYDAGDAVANNTAFTGTIDEVKVYSGLLSQSEIQVDMNAGSAAALGGVLGTQDNEGFGGNPPVGWWKMDEAAANSCTGGVNDSCDSSGNANNGAWINNATNSSGKFGNAVTLDGIDDYIDLGTSFPALGSQFTIAGWVYLNSFSGFPTIFARMNFSNLDYRIVYYNNGGVNELCGEVSYDGTEPADAGACTPNKLTTNAWHHFAFVKDATQIIMYLNSEPGDPDPTSGTVNQNASVKTTIGIRQDLSQEINGRVDDYRVYDYALTPAQVAYIYNRGAPVGHWEFDECQGATAYNSALNANNEAAGMNGTITIGALGEDTLGDCTTSSTAWGSGATGKYNSSLDFDGTDDYVTVSDDNLLDFGTSQDFTLSAWIKSTQAAVLNKYFSAVVKYDGATTKGYGISLHNSTTDARWYCQILNVSSSLQYGRSDVADGNWHHLVCTRSGSTLLTYQDGAPANSGTAITSDLSNAVALLISGNATSTYFPGQIDDVRIYRYALTAGQIQRLYNEGFAQRFGPQTGSP